jgi:uncharacterized membrane-anchored protein
MWVFLAPTSGAEQLMTGGKQGGEERFIAREDLAGADVVCRLHFSVSL